MLDALPMDLKSLILVVDDDAELRSLISGFLGSHGYRVAVADNAEAMRKQMAVERPDLIVLDVMLPGEDGLSAARRIAGSEDAPPIIMLSALGSETDRIIGLEVGADDYLAKPCNPRELLARVRARLRRRSQADRTDSSTAGRYGFAGWSIDVVRQDLRDPAGTVINLSSGEFSLLRTFLENPQRVLTRDQLLELARGANVDSFDRAIDTQISRLRRKLNERTEVELIRTVRNQGYQFLPEVTRQ